MRGAEWWSREGKSRLFPVLSLFVVYLAALGCAATSGFRGEGDPLGRAGTSLAAGILVDFLLVLTGLPLGAGLAVGGALGLAGVWSLARRRGQRAFAAPPADVIAAAGVVVLVLALYYFRILLEPLQAWDARSIWFFHAKKIWIDGGLKDAGWNHPSIVFSNPDYPVLVPAIAAQLGYLRGFWNEFFPKASLLVMLLPPLLWTFSIRRAAPSFVLLVLLFFFSYYEWLSNGYMDAYLAIYSGFALLFMGRYLRSRHEPDLVTALCAIGIACSLKNEGLLFALCLGAAVAALGLLDTGVLRALAGSIRRTPSVAVAAALALAPVLVWTGYTRAWGLQNSVAGKPSEALARLAARAGDGESVRLVVDYLAVRANGLWLVAALVLLGLAVTRAERWRVHPGALAGALTALMHFAGMALVYLSTPTGLAGHLDTSAARTMNTTRVVLFVALYFLLADMETLEVRGWWRGRRGEQPAGPLEGPPETVY